MDVSIYKFPCKNEVQNCLKLDENSRRSQGMPQRITEFLLDFCIQKVKSRSAPARIVFQQLALYFKLLSFVPFINE